MSQFAVSHSLIPLCFFFVPLLPPSPIRRRLPTEPIDRQANRVGKNPREECLREQRRLLINLGRWDPILLCDRDPSPTLSVDVVAFALRSKAGNLIAAATQDRSLARSLPHWEPIQSTLCFLNLTLALPRSDCLPSLSK